MAEEALPEGTGVHAEFAADRAARGHQRLLDEVRTSRLRAATVEAAA